METQENMFRELTQGLQEGFEKISKENEDLRDLLKHHQTREGQQRFLTNSEPQEEQQDDIITSTVPLVSQKMQHGRNHSPYPWGAQDCEFSMEAKLDTVKEVWEEYFIGINGKMPIIERERCVNHWRQLARVDRRFFFKRSVLGGD